MSSAVHTARRAARSAGRELVARAWGAVRPVARRLPGARGAGCISLCYHRITDDRAVTDPWLVTHVDTFRRQVETLQRSYEIVTMQEVAEVVSGGRRPRRPLCAITFDDGYADNLYRGLPVLERLGAPATIYLTTDAMVGAALWFERVGATVKAALARGTRRELTAAAREVLGAPCGPDEGVVDLTRRLCEALKRRPTAERVAAILALERRVGPPDQADLPRYLGWDEVRELARAGWEIGNHTRTHVILPETDDEAAKDEIGGAHAAIVREIGRGPVGFAYPNGDCDERIVRLVRDAGYRYAVVATPPQAAPGDPHRLARRCVSDHSSAGLLGAFSAASFLAEVEGAFDRLRA